MEPSDSLRELARAGIDLDGMTQGQREVLAALTAEEVALLVRVKQQLDEHAPEVVAHSMVGGMFF
jgi:hypothetical protein